MENVYQVIAGGILVLSLVVICYCYMRKTYRSLQILSRELVEMLEKKEFRAIQIKSHGWTGELIDRVNQLISGFNDKSDKYERLSLSYEDLEISNKITCYEKERIESVIENMDDGIILTDPSGNIILANSAMAHLMEFHKESVAGKSIQDCIENQDILTFFEKNQIFYSNLFTHKNFEFSMTRGGVESIFFITYMPLLNREESITGSIVLARDVSVQKLARKTQSEFLAHVTHELRTPLNTIKSYVEMLMDDEINDRDTKVEFFNTINDEANRLARLIGNLLNISKIEMGNLSISKDLLKTREFMHDIVKSVESQAVNKKIDLECILPEKLPALVVDKDLMRVAILNLLSNAIKYTPVGGRVKFKVEEDRSHVRVEVHDTGHGISDEDLPRIFDKFFRSGDDKIKENTGNGLGLAIAREIIKLHNGNIEVASTLRKGTSFILSLPMEESPKINNYDRTYNSLLNN